MSNGKPDPTIRRYHWNGALYCMTLKRNGKLCKGIAIKRTTKCRVHGGPMLKKSLKTGLYSQYQPQRIQEKVEELLKNPQLMNMHQHVALLSALLADVFETIQARIKEDQKKATTEEERLAAERLVDAEIQGIMALSDKTTIAIERAARIGLGLKMLVSLDAVNEILDGFVEVAAKFIKTDKAREKFAKELYARGSMAVDRDDVRNLNQLVKQGTTRVQ